MKIKRVLTNNKKKSFHVNLGKQSYEFPYNKLKIKPTLKDPIYSVCVDKEIDSMGFTYTLESGKSDTVLLDQVLEINADPEHARKKILYELTLLAQDSLTKSGLTKRALSRKLNTTPTQLYRLLDQTFYGKTIDQMVKLLCALEVDVEIKKVA